MYTEYCIKSLTLNTCFISINNLITSPIYAEALVKTSLPLSTLDKAVALPLIPNKKNHTINL